jgi:hypothetical protein
VSPPDRANITPFGFPARRGFFIGAAGAAAEDQRAGPAPPSAQMRSQNNRACGGAHHGDVGAMRARSGTAAAA